MLVHTKRGNDRQTTAGVGKEECLPARTHSELESVLRFYDITQKELAHNFVCYGNGKTGTRRPCKARSWPFDEEDGVAGA